ncbi:MAG: hypothetical protein ACPGXY_02125 [Alphaproteobacteria bacterium]
MFKKTLLTIGLSLMVSPFALAHTDGEAAHGTTTGSEQFTTDTKHEGTYADHAQHKLTRIYPGVCRRGQVGQAPSYLNEYMGVMEWTGGQWKFKMVSGSGLSGGDTILLHENVGQIATGQSADDVILKSRTPQGFRVFAHVDEKMNDGKGLVVCLSTAMPGAKIERRLIERSEMQHENRKTMKAM